MFGITTRDLTSMEASRVDGSCSRNIAEVVILGDSGTWRFVRYSFEHPRSSAVRYLFTHSERSSAYPCTWRSGVVVVLGIGLLVHLTTPEEELGTQGGCDHGLDVNSARQLRHACCGEVRKPWFLVHARAASSSRSDVA